MKFIFRFPLDHPIVIVVFVAIEYNLTIQRSKNKRSIAPYSKKKINKSNFELISEFSRGLISLFSFTISETKIE